MILINLLPPELRKRTTTVQFQPIYAILAAGILVDLLTIGGYFWLKGRLKTGEQTRDDMTADLATKTTEAAVVDGMLAEIDAFRSRRDNIFELLGRKVYLAKNLDDFSNLMTGAWSVPGFQARAQDLSITELSFDKGKAGQPGIVTYAFRMRFKLVGDENAKSGEYNKSFYTTIENSAFWREYGFIGRPEDRYNGDDPRWNEALKKVVVEGSVDWQRTKVAVFALAAKTKDGAKPAGN